MSPDDYCLAVIENLGHLVDVLVVVIRALVVVLLVSVKRLELCSLIQADQSNMDHGLHLTTCICEHIKEENVRKCNPSF